MSAHTAERVRSVLDDHPELSWLGYGGNGEDITEGRAQLASPESIEEIGRAADWAIEHLAERKAVNYWRTSYGLKHLAEPDIGYVTNGQMAVALVMAGFRLRPVPGSPNPAFNISEPSAKRLEERRRTHI
jgi:hypothetical protein